MKILASGPPTLAALGFVAYIMQLWFGPAARVLAAGLWALAGWWVLWGSR
ncbi:MAG: hypothetical protein K6U87_07460 [Firmicutes bacterium]|nr:hypothetical protein [Bacillota bacterium]